MVFNLFIQLLLDECGDSYAVDGRFCLFVCPVRARAYARSCVRQTEFATVQESAVFSAITRENSALTQTLLMRLQAQSALALALESTACMHRKWSIQAQFGFVPTLESTSFLVTIQEGVGITEGQCLPEMDEHKAGGDKPTPLRYLNSYYQSQGNCSMKADRREWTGASRCPYESLRLQHSPFERKLVLASICQTQPFNILVGYLIP